MHRAAVAVLTLLVLAAAVSAQTASPVSYALAEEDGTWVHTHTLQATGNASYRVQDGLEVLEVRPEGATATVEGDTVTVTAPGDGATEVTIRFRGPASFTVPDLGGAPLAIATDRPVEAPREPTSVSGDTATYDAQPGETYTVSTGGTTVTVTHTLGPAPVPGTPGFDWVALGAGLLAGILLWSFLVQRGLVQRRSRKQTVSLAAHTAAAAEGEEMLEARRRTLMAALKDLEKARMNKEVSVDVYDRLKAELKKETVTVMRALEAARN